LPFRSGEMGQVVWVMGRVLQAFVSFSRLRAMA